MDNLHRHDENDGSADPPFNGGEPHDHEPAADDHDHRHEHDHKHGSGFLGWVKGIYHPHSHDSVDSIDSALEASEKGIRTVKISLVGLMATAIFQVVIVLLTGSIALLADTIHNFSDALTSIPLWIAFLLGRRAVTRSYTYGYRRAEDLSGLFIVLMIAFSAVLAGWESIDRLLNPEEVQNLGLVAAAGVIGFIGNEIVAIYRIRVGREIGSAALIADGQHARTDGLTSLAVVFGAIGVGMGFPAADPIIGLLITVAILFVLKDATKQVFRRLMDGVEPEITDVVEKKAVEVNGVIAAENIRIRWMGHRLDASLQVVVDPEISVGDGHEIAAKVRDNLKGAMPHLDTVVIHVEPDGLVDTEEFQRRNESPMLT